MSPEAARSRMQCLPVKSEASGHFVKSSTLDPSDHTLYTEYAYRSRKRQSLPTYEIESPPSGGDKGGVITPGPCPPAVILAPIARIDSLYMDGELTVTSEPSSVTPKTCCTRKSEQLSASPVLPARRRYKVREERPRNAAEHTTPGGKRYGKSELDVVTIRRAYSQTHPTNYNSLSHAHPSEVKPPKHTQHTGENLPSHAHKSKKSSTKYILPSKLTHPTKMDPTKYTLPTEMNPIKHTHSNEMNPTKYTHPTEMNAIKHTHSNDMNPTKHTHSTEINPTKHTHSTDINPTKHTHSTEINPTKHTHSTDMNPTKHTHSTNINPTRNSHTMQYNQPNGAYRPTPIKVPCDTHLSSLCRLNSAPDSPLDHEPLNHSPLDHGPLDHGPLEHGPLDHGPLDHGPLDEAHLLNGDVGQRGVSPWSAVRRAHSDAGSTVINIYSRSGPRRHRPNSAHKHHERILRHVVDKLRDYKVVRDGEEEEEEDEEVKERSHRSIKNLKLLVFSRIIYIIYYKI